MNTSTQVIKLDVPELNGIEASKSTQIKAIFEPMSEMLLEFETQYFEVITEAKEEITKDVTVKAKKIRLAIGKVRIETEKLRKGQKEEYLRAGKAIDSVSNILKWAITDKEDKLKEIENYFEIQKEKARKLLASQRQEELSRYIEVGYQATNLGDMNPDVWEIYLQAKKNEYNDKVVAEKKAEEKRIKKEKEAEIERTRIMEENERLRKEAETRRIEEQQNRAIQEAKEIKSREEKEKLEIKLREEKKEKEQLQKQIDVEKVVDNTTIEENLSLKQWIMIAYNTGYMNGHDDGCNGNYDENISKYGIEGANANKADAIIKRYEKAQK